MFSLGRMISLCLGKLMCLQEKLSNRLVFLKQRNKEMWEERNVEKNRTKMDDEKAKKLKEKKEREFAVLREGVCKPCDKKEGCMYVHKTKGSDKKVEQDGFKR